MRTRAITLVLAVSAIGLLMLAVAWTAAVTHAAVQKDDRYGFDFQRIACDVPAGMDPHAFLSEIQYITNVPSRLSALSHELPAQIAEAFGRHPWVQAVERVELRAPRSLTVHLTFRKPVLQVMHQGTAYAVDRHGILLPASAVTDALPVHRGLVSAPAGPIGSAWGDPLVETAARETAKTGPK